MRLRNLLAEYESPVLLDVGSGKTACITEGDKNLYRVRLIGLDISEQEMQDNHLLDEKLIADAQACLGVPDRSVDIIVSRCVCEHMRDPRAYYSLAWHALKPGGIMINLIPNPLAPHYFANRLLPSFVSRMIVPRLVPERKRLGVFKAYYIECTPVSNEHAIRACGAFETAIHYGDSGHYYMLLPPVYLGYLIWGWFWNKLGIHCFNDLFFIEARKPLN
ncbi:MAG: methyltransferase domain-containing protein [Desulfobacterales bacterium]|nr:methyltransferase domain-containing protein [Desulfobacterales bacterium]